MNAEVGEEHGEGGQQDTKGRMLDVQNPATGQREEEESCGNVSHKHVAKT
jgi:hypothetical protein